MRVQNVLVTQDVLVSIPKIHDGPDGPFLEPGCRSTTNHRFSGVLHTLAQFDDIDGNPFDRLRQFVQNSLSLRGFRFHHHDDTEFTGRRPVLMSLVDLSPDNVASAVRSHSESSSRTVRTRCQSEDDVQLFLAAISRRASSHFVASGSWICISMSWQPQGSALFSADFEAGCFFVTLCSMASYEVIESISVVSIQYSFILWKQIAKHKLSLMTSMSQSSKESTKRRLIRAPLSIASLFGAPNEQGRRNVGLANYHL